MVSPALSCFLFSLAWFARKGSALVSASAAPLPAPVPGEAEREVVRARHNVRLLNEAEEGLGLDRLPSGVYGFTYSPALPNGPVFRKKQFHAFEIHKPADGEARLIGFVNAETATKIETSLESGAETFHVSLFADPSPGATAPVSLETRRIVRHREHSQREGNGLQLEVTSQA